MTKHQSTMLRNCELRTCWSSHLGQKSLINHSLAYCGTWWLSGKFGAFCLEGRSFESHSSRTFASSVSSASSPYLLRLPRLSPLLSLPRWTEHCNSLLACAPARLLDGLQLLNATGGSMTTSSHSSMIFSTGCLIHINLCLLIFQSLFGVAPEYLHWNSFLCIWASAPIAYKDQFHVWRTRTRFGDWAFSAVGPPPPAIR